MQMKSAEIRKNAKSKTGVSFDYSLPDEGDWTELKEITGIGQDNVFEYIVSMYEKRLLSSMRLRFFPTMKDIVHPKSGQKFKITSLDHRDKDAVAAAVHSVKLIRPKVGRAKPISSQDAWLKLENDLRKAGVDKARIEEFRKQHQAMLSETANSAVAND